MSYQESLVAAGAEVHCFREFGSYQGAWWAKVTYKGITGWTEGSYGSCSGCDSFQAEFDYCEQKCEEHKWDSDINENQCSECEKAKENYNRKLENFGKAYLEDVLLTQKQAEKKVSKDLEWDSEASEVLAFLKANKL